MPTGAWFGPYTRMRLMAFQAFAGVTPTGVADAGTWARLKGGVPGQRPRWSDGRLSGSSGRCSRRIRRGRSLWCAACRTRIRCGSETLRAGGPGACSSTGTSTFFGLGSRAYARALDPEWNVRTARTIWARTGDFRHWSCEPGPIPVAPR
ncbi:peptidoglycan-binding domain-containing protein [Spirillospora sp. NPDC047279]|uniref:peptidoglycan-binding domain-containing protein n=1 Tax=Spirillospora sp. NPDC047279 TaxID=3155478 RepID=UPI0033E1BDCD